MHGLYVLARGRLFAEEWGQLANTSLARGLAAYLAFETMEEEIGRERLNEIRRDDWTIWNLRRIGAEFDDLNWEDKFQPLMKYGRYKERPRMETVFWSTRFVYYLIDRYGSDFPDRMFAEMGAGEGSNHRGHREHRGGDARLRQGYGVACRGPEPSEADIFQAVTGHRLERVVRRFWEGKGGAARQ